MKFMNIIKRSHSFVALLLILLLLVNSLGQIREIEISRVFQATPRRSANFFRVHGRFGGGVAPRGSAEFTASSNPRLKLSARQMKFVVKDVELLKNDESDFDAVGIQWNGKVYKFAVQDDLLLPMMKFVKRDGAIAYTLGRRFVDEYVTQNGLVSAYGRSSAYVAKEFNTEAHKDFLKSVDFADFDEIADPAIKTKLMIEAERFGGPIALFGERTSETDDDSYINGDFNVKYQALLDNKKQIVNVGGLPFSYSWETNNGKIKVTDVFVFTYPERDYDKQYRAILFFHAAAILRQFKQDNPREFNRFLAQVTKIVGNG